MAEKKNPSEGYRNPFFRDKESEYDGGEKRTLSPVASIFSHDYVRKDGSNVMEDRLTSRLDRGSDKVVSKQRGGKK
ncbi:MAG: hypothetical protein WCD38_11880 [Candidatus Tumulicola sp.]